MATIEALEFLRPMAQLFMNDKTYDSSLVLGVAARPKYQLCNKQSEPLGLVGEDDPILMGRTSFGRSRGVTMRVYDNEGREAVRFIRPHSLVTDKVDVLHVNTILGRIERPLQCFSSEMSIHDCSERKIFTITGPFSVNLMTSAAFTVTNADGRQVGLIKKRWTGWGPTGTSTIDIFGLNFSVNLNVIHKVLIISAAILIDMVYYQKK